MILDALKPNYLLSSLAFQQIAPTFQSFIQQSQQSSSFNSFSQSINPFINVMQPFIPSFGGLSSFGGFSQQSSSQGSQSQSSYNASPWGTSSSQSSSSFSQQQSSQAVQAFQPVLGLLGQMQGSIAGGAMSQSVASSYVNQLVSQLQPALNGINACGCFGAVCFFFFSLSLS